MTRPSDESGSDAAKWWNEQSQEELDKLEFLQKEMMRAMDKDKKMVSGDDEEEDMGPPDLPEDDEDMGPQTCQKMTTMTLMTRTRTTK